MAAVLFGTLFLAAVVAGIAIHYLMGELGLIPEQRIPGGTLSGGYTLVLNLVFTPVFLAQVYVVYGPERIASIAREMPRQARNALGTARAASRRVRRTGWAFALDVGEAVVKALESLRLLVASLAALWRALSMIVGAVIALMFELLDSGTNTNGPKITRSERGPRYR